MTIEMYGAHLIDAHQLVRVADEPQITCLEFGGMDKHGTPFQVLVRMEPMATRAMKEKLCDVAQTGGGIMSAPIYDARLIKVSTYSGDGHSHLQFSGVDNCNGKQRRVDVRMSPEAVAQMMKEFHDKLCTEQRYRFCPWCGERLK